MKNEFLFRLGNLVARNHANISMVITVIALALAGVITWIQVFWGFGLFSAIFIAFSSITHVLRKE